MDELFYHAVECTVQGYPMKTTRIPLSWIIAVVLAALLVMSLAACTAQPAPEEDLDWLPNAPGTDFYSGPAETTIDTLMLAGHDVFGNAYSWPQTRLLLIESTTKDEVVSFYESQLKEHGWELLPDAGLAFSIGSSWQRGNQRLAVAYLETGGAQIVVIVMTTRR